MSPRPVDVAQVRSAARAVLDAVAADPRYARTAHLQVRLGPDVVVDEHLRGPERGDVFSVTKTVLALTLAVAAREGRLPPLDQPVAAVLPGLQGTPAERHTWTHLLTMTRGAETGGAWDVDEVTALPGGQVAHVARAPQRTPPGSAFAYDNGASHLLSAAAGAVLGEPVSAFAARALLAPLGVPAPVWTCDPDGVPFGYGHLRLAADDLGRLGRLLLDGGRVDGRPLLDPAFLAAMTTPQTAGGPPEDRPYGYHLWLDDGMPLAGGWAGQHLLVVPAADAVVVTTGDAGFDPGPPATDAMPADWQPALTLVQTHLLPVLRG
ncbi:Beta-lactamase [Friedmanniella luteola]|uniref:Beta-lactamase n=1 Tax=Friedmanniella luteola TaxID=546871 RepID=A0A1H1RZ04_9ACTN|nr:serine hydrolase domain-containing protein [Friedmanniella luteola]SDS40967.1 Beta-lactamase [Friedmanniella luteola]